MIEFWINKVNNDYIMMSKLNLISATLDFDIPSDIRDEAMNILLLLSTYEKEEKCAPIKEVAINKNEGIGKFLSSCELEEVRNLDFEINYEDIVNAFNIAAFEGSSLLSDIYKMFLNQEFGLIEDLTKKYGEEVVSYVLINNDFDMYMKKLNGIYSPEQFYTYENDKIVKRNLDLGYDDNCIIRKLL